MLQQDIVNEESIEIKIPYTVLDSINIFKVAFETFCADPLPFEKRIILLTAVCLSSFFSVQDYLM